MATVNDKLLKLTSTAIKLAFVLVIVFMAITLIALPTLVLAPEQVGIVDAYRHLDRQIVVRMAEIWLAGGLVISVMLLVVLRRLRKIIDSAAIGDPFVRENATRLGQIGWLMLAINVVQTVCTVAIGVFVSKPAIDFDPTSISWSGFFTVLLIFVVARIFQRGSEMCADLEGTV